MMKRHKLAPTILFLVIFFAAILLHLYLPFTFSMVGADAQTLCFVGIFILLLSLLINLLAYRSFQTHRTPHAPFSLPSALITEGIFKYTRNPVYIALIFSHGGLGCILDSVWVLFGAFVLFAFLDLYIVEEEENILFGRFKEEYTRYRAATRRWF